MTPADKEMVRDVVRDKSYLAYPMTKKLLDALDAAEAEIERLKSIVRRAHMSLTTVPELSFPATEVALILEEINSETERILADANMTLRE